ncbi:unnamed protein product [Echinostoma caproni]|uniref:Ion_trans domain-containing protein n=1 Tax=Echinostoma caproni TaxID=27848 RepID=A0A183A5B3_9TREM|nr:unnamed protein product [Echinostoma caproni]
MIPVNVQFKINGPVNARWILLRLVPIKNEQDSVVLFLLTFRDVTAYRQPVEDDLAANSALGAFAAASDPGSSWGRFARLVFSMVRQRTGSMTERDGGEEQNTGEINNTIPGSDVPNKLNECNLVSGDLDQSASNPPKFAPTENRKRDSLPTTCCEVGELNTDQRLKLSAPHAERSKSECVKVTDRTNFLELQRLEEAMCKADEMDTVFGPPKRTILRRLFRTRRNVVHTSVTDSTSLGSSTKRSGSTRIVNPNPDSEDYSNNHWLSSETAPKYRLEPPCPPKHVLLHYSAFRLIWDWTILLLTGYTAVVVPLRLAIIPRPTWVAVSSAPPLDTHRSLSTWMTRPSVPESLAIADAVIDIIFCLDIVLNFHTSFVGAGGEVVAEPPVIRVNYLSGWFTLDLISCLPYEIIKYCWSSENQELHSLLDGLRIIRLLRIGRAARRIDQYLEYVSTLLLLMIVCFFLLAHWFACAWYAVGVLDLENKIQYGWIPRYFNDSLRPQNWNAFVTFDSWDTNTSNVESNNGHYEQEPWIRKTRMAWDGQSLHQSISPSSMGKQFGVGERTPRDLSFRKPVPLQNAMDKWSAYLTALYFSLSLLTTIGFGNVAAFTEAEKMLSICCMLIGGE